MNLIGALEETATAEAASLFDTNVFGILRTTQAVLPHMRTQRRGRIVNVSPVLGFLPAPYMWGFTRRPNTPWRGFPKAWITRCASSASAWRWCNRATPGPIWMPIRPCELEDRGLRPGARPRLPFRRRQHRQRTRARRRGGDDRRRGARHLAHAAHAGRAGILAEQVAPLHAGRPCRCQFEENTRTHLRVLPGIVCVLSFDACALVRPYRC